MHGRIDRIAIAEEDSCRLMGQQPTGRALAGCIRAIAESPGGLWLVSDHNGEAARAMEFGTAISRVSRSQSSLAATAVDFGGVRRRRRGEWGFWGVSCAKRTPPEVRARRDRRDRVYG